MVISTLSLWAADSRATPATSASPGAGRPSGSSSPARIRSGVGGGDAPRVLVAGCGDVGTALGLMLCERGCDVIGVRRSAERLPASLRPLSIDVTDRRALERMAPRADVAVYAVAAGRRDEEAYRRAYVDGVAALLDVLEGRSDPPRRVFFVSSTSVYGERGGAWVDETTPVQPRGFSGECLVAGERRMLASPIPATVVRFGGIYGPGRGWLIERARAGAHCVDDPPRFTNRIHRDDCAGALAHLIARTWERGRPARFDHSRALSAVIPAKAGIHGSREHRRPAPDERATDARIGTEGAPTSAGDSPIGADEVYVGVDDAPATECEVLEWLAARLDAPAPRRIRGEEAASQGSGKRCSNARLRAIGYRFRYPTYREGYAAVLAGEGVRHP